MNCKSPGFSVHGISQARILKWIAVSFSRKIFSTQGLNPCLLNTCPTLQADSLPLSHQDHNGPCFGSNDSTIVWKCHLGLYLSFLIRVFFCFEHFLSPKHWLQSLTWSAAFISFTYPGEDHETRVFYNLHAWYIT